MIRLAINPKEKLWFDVGGMDICTVGTLLFHDIQI
jgi:hypothetical protein